jgi:hypothetical protein
MEILIDIEDNNL